MGCNMIESYRFQGYVKTWRKVLSSTMYKGLTASQRDVFWICLLLANHKHKEWEWKGDIFECDPGQFITSLANIEELCAKDTSTRNIRTALNKLEKWQFLTSESTKTGRLITILNWGSYQMQENNTDKGNAKEVTKDRQRGDKEVTTTKNDKECTKNEGR